ncbi:MAG: type II secretion system F family protein [Candidatus Omnitrophica bacterium]|nr:type II secretion system F family protein [Candidatus Omnitrophota bacterium]MDD5552675.1 type II secretion system F family protein [Candidatus Omnitrophota bacterium]
MPRYLYTAKSQPQKIEQGEIEADSQLDAVNRLAKTGHFPVTIELEETFALNKNGILKLRRFSKSDTAVFTRQLSTLIESGVNLLKGLTIIYSQSRDKYLKAVLSDVIGQVKDGKPLSESLARHPGLFSDLYTSMARSGEVGGNIEEALKRLADHLDKEEEFKNSIRAALTYPLFVLGVGALTIIVLLGFVIPKLVEMFEDMGEALPLPTKILIGISNGLRSYWWVIIAVIVILAFLFQRLLRAEKGMIFWSGFKLKLKVWGPITLKSEISRLMRTLSLLLSSGIAIVYSLDISSKVISNHLIKLEVQKFKEQISRGLSLSRCLNNSRIFPELAASIVAIGEESGTLEVSLARIADDYERDVDRSLKALSRLLEPVMILVMGLIVGFIVLSMLLPIFQINLLVR